MQKPPGVGRPACVSLARFAAFGPTRSGSVALRSFSETTKRAIRNSFGLVAAHSLSPEGRGWGGGARALRVDLCFRTPHPRSLRSLDLSPLGRGEVATAVRSLPHMIAIARQRIDHGDLLDREIGHDLDIVLVRYKDFFIHDAVAELFSGLGLQR